MEVILADYKNHLYKYHINSPVNYIIGFLIDFNYHIDNFSGEVSK